LSGAEGAYIEVGDGNKLVWEAGKAFAFDDSFEHKVAVKGGGCGVLVRGGSDDGVFIVGFWPPRRLTASPPRNSS